ncbi:hypothetical protein ACWA7J_21220 [Leptothrix sp. BB-4]
MKHEITDLADELLLALSSNPSIEIDDDLASLMRSMDELLRLYQARGEPEKAEFLSMQDAALQPDLLPAQTAGSSVK